MKIIAFIRNLINMNFIININNNHKLKNVYIILYYYSTFLFKYLDFCWGTPTSNILLNLFGFIVIFFLSTIDLDVDKSLTDKTIHIKQCSFHKKNMKEPIPINDNARIENPVLAHPFFKAILCYVIATLRLSG